MFSPLHSQFIVFAKGMPAIAISWAYIQRDVDALLKTLAGTNPGQPAPSMRDIPMPVYGLAYSVFVQSLTIAQSGNNATIQISIAANVHPRGNPDKVIFAYDLQTTNPAVITLDFSKDTNEVFWRAQGSVVPTIQGAFGPDADTALAMTTIPVPQRDTYLTEVDRPIRWLTAPTLISLVTDALPRYALGEFVPWLRFVEPLRIRTIGTHILITASRAHQTIGACSPTDVVIEPDPAFPYGEVIPAPSGFLAADMALYVPRTRLFEFFAKAIEPAILVSSSGGGVIKWSMAGSVGLKQLVLDILSANGLSGVLWTRAVVDFVASARAWIDGPCGTKIGLASASVIGKGAFEAKITLTLDLAAAVVEATLEVTQADLPNVDWDVHTPLGWPIDAVAGEIINHISTDEVRKLVGTVKKLGRWSIVGLPWRYVENLPTSHTLTPISEGLANVSVIVALRDNPG